MTRLRAAYPIKIFYDGSCHVCSAEVGHYMRKFGGTGAMEFIDIATPDFAPERYGRTLDTFMRRMHAIDADGRVFTGVDALAAIWLSAPSKFYGTLGRLVTLPLVHGLAALGYRAFARIRLYLPKKRAACSSGACRAGR